MVQNNFFSMLEAGHEIHLIETARVHKAGAKGGPSSPPALNARHTVRNPCGWVPWPLVLGPNSLPLLCVISHGALS